MKTILQHLRSTKVTAEQGFMLSVLVVNGGNYLYNLILGRVLGPEQFADAAILITFLLILSFVAMTFQLVTAKFSILFEGSILKEFINKVYQKGIFIGFVIGFILIVFSSFLQDFFQTKSSVMFIIFGIGIPIYFLMSIHRGVFQGKKAYAQLSITYQSEMISRLLLTLAILFCTNLNTSLVIALGILISLFFGLFPIKFQKVPLQTTNLLDVATTKKIYYFFGITAFYELTQIAINNSDIVLVKHFFPSYEAGLYASLALIGRVVYFVAWMFVMLLLPNVVEKQKRGEETTSILFKYVLYISILATAIILVCFLFPKLIITLLFGNSYVAIAPLLWKYALATGIFSVANIFAYYYLSIGNYIPVIGAAFFGFLQIVFVIIWHANLMQIVNVQILAMLLLLSFQLGYFLYYKNRNKGLSTYNYD